MANQAEKKAQQRVKDFRKHHGMALSVVFLVYVIFRMAIFNSSWERHHTIAFAISTMVQYICYSVIFSHIEGGGTIDQKGGMVSPCRDILYLLMFSQTISLYTVWAWCVMIVVPVFATYYFITGVILPWIFGGDADSDAKIEVSKTQQKKARRLEKFGGKGR